MINNSICAIFIFILFSPLQAQNFQLGGSINDIADYRFLSDAFIQAVNQNVESTISLENGSFSMSVLQAKGELRVTLMGYETKTVKYDINNMPINIQLKANTQLLNEVRVIAFSGNKTSKETAGAITHLGAEKLQQGSGTSIQSALNSIPGVRMDQSSLSDARISIRGNGMRSPWGTRGVQIYINDIPLTEADGTTRIEGLDVNDLGQAEIIRGPATSLYRSGTGGVINFQLKRAPYQEQSLEVSGLAGSFGLGRIATTYRGGGENMNSYVSYGHQVYDGYRIHSKDKRDFLTANFQFTPTKKRAITVLVNRTSQDTQIPGTLTLEEVHEDRKQANSGNVDKRAGRTQNWTRIGLGQRYVLNKNITNISSLYTYFYDLDHPLPFAYIHSFYQGIGGRTRFDYQGNFKILPTKFTIGGEYNSALSKGTQYVNVSGKEGTMNGNTDFKYTTFSLFYQSETYITKKTSVTLGLNYNDVVYAVKEYLLPNESGRKQFELDFSPRVALSHNFGSYLSLHGSVSKGTNTPTGSEIKNEDGTVNQNLQAEQAVNYEVNAKGSFINSKFAYDLAVFKQQVKGELIPQNVQQGITIYHNSGRTEHNGVELALSYSIFDKREEGVISLNTYLSVTYSDFRFSNFKMVDKNGDVIANYDRNFLAGISPWTVDMGLDLKTKWGVYVHTVFYFSDRFYLNNANTDSNPAYSVLNFKLGYEKEIGKRLLVNIYGGMDNVTNEKYSSLTALNTAVGNGVAPAYFNPSMPMNGYTGLKIKYIL